LARRWLNWLPFGSEWRLLVVECPVCLRDIQLGENVHEGDILQCPYCKIWFKLVRVNGEWVGERVIR
jgi:hypothetical protein